MYDELEPKNSYHSGCFSLVEREFCPQFTKRKTLVMTLSKLDKNCLTLSIYLAKKFLQNSFDWKNNIRILLSLVIMELATSEHGG